MHLFFFARLAFVFLLARRNPPVLRSDQNKFSNLVLEGERNPSSRSFIRRYSEKILILILIITIIHILIYFGVYSNHHHPRLVCTGRNNF